ALPRELTQATKFYLNNNTDKGKITADFAIEKVIATFEALFKEQWEENDVLITRKEKRLYDKRNNPKKRFHHDDNRKNAFLPTSTDKSKRGICKYHPGLTGHTTLNCLLNPEDKKKIDNIYQKFGPNAKFCYTCKAANYKKGEHKCPGRPKQTIKKRKTNDTVVPMAVDTTDTETESDNDNSDSHMTFSALTIEDKQDNCKSTDTDFSKPPANLMKNNSLILPITLESQHCIVKTYFLLETGASFSCISPALADELKIELNKKDFGTIKTCQRDNVVERIGSTIEKIKIT
ncbi:hypothetical protein, partial, partial [Parasitella parasitica]